MKNLKKIMFYACISTLVIACSKEYIEFGNTSKNKENSATSAISKVGPTINIPGGTLALVPVVGLPTDIHSSPIVKGTTWDVGRDGLWVTTGSASIICLYKDFVYNGTNVTCREAQRIYGYTERISTDYLGYVWVIQPSDGMVKYTNPYFTSTWVNVPGIRAIDIANRGGGIAGVTPYDVWVADVYHKIYRCNGAGWVRDFGTWGEECIRVSAALTSNDVIYNCMRLTDFSGGWLRIKNDNPDNPNTSILNYCMDMDGGGWADLNLALTSYGIFTVGIDNITHAPVKKQWPIDNRALYAATDIAYVASARYWNGNGPYFFIRLNSGIVFACVRISAV
jgi:hypothetical protein